MFVTFKMKSRTGFIQYLNFQAGSDKGGVQKGDLFNNPFQLGEMTDDRVRYTSEAVVDTATAGAAFTAAWTPVVPGSFVVITVDGEVVEFDPKATYTAEELATKAVKDAKIVVVDTVDETGVATTTVKFADFTDGSIAATEFPAAEAGHTVSYKVAFKYDNVTIPQNDIPQVIAVMKGISLSAKARRVAIRKYVA